MRAFKAWLASFVFASLGVVISAAWFDRPLAYLIHNSFGQFEFLGKFTGAPSFFSPLAAAIFIVFLMRRVALRSFGRLDAVLIMCDVSVILAKLIVSPLKMVFGRTWPQYHHPSLIQDGVYGFNPFHGGVAFESFPSGHMASIFALVIILWWCYPAFRIVYAGCIVAMAAALLVGNYHFLGDLIGGGLVGFSAATFTALLWELWLQRRSHPKKVNFPKHADPLKLGHSAFEN